MELELGLAPPTNIGSLPGELGGTKSVSASAAARGGGKRGFDEAFEEDEYEQSTAEAPTTTLPLFDDGSSSSGCSSKKKKALVGWPPVSWARSRACVVVSGAGGGRHVKVRKEGTAIGRKVDLSLHGCYGDLLATLERLFPATAGDCLAVAEKDAALVVTYEDADGDWMLLGDVPWEDFARSVKRLKILL